MKEGFDIYQHKRHIEASLKKLEKSDLSRTNKDSILGFYRYCTMQGMSRARLIRYLLVLVQFSRIMEKDFINAEKSDIELLVAKIQEQDVAPWTKHTSKVMLKRFYKWLKGHDEEYPPEVKWIKPTIKKSEEKLISDGELITEEEIKKALEASKNPRDRALISMLYESGCRIGELATLQIGNVTIDEHGAVISVMGKTGSRKVRLISSVPYLREWLRAHPRGEDKNEPLWVGIGTRNSKSMLRYDTIRLSLVKLFKKAGINKRCNPHFFRHSRATYLANHLTEFQMNQYLGWVQGSNMPSIYVHMSGKETDKAILALNGINMSTNSKESILKPKTCPRCETVNGVDSKFCSKCSGILDLHTAILLEQNKKVEQKTRNSSDLLMNMLMQDPEIRDIMMKKLIELKVNNPEI